MVQSVFIDQHHVPQAEELHETLGSAGPLWDQLNCMLTNVVVAQGTWVWNGRRPGWELHFRRSGRPLTTLLPTENAFVALILLGRHEAAEAGWLDLGERTRATFAGARQYPEGRLVDVHVRDRDDLEDVTALLAVKLPQRIREIMALRIQGQLHVTAGIEATSRT